MTGGAVSLLRRGTRAPHPTAAQPHCQAHRNQVPKTGLREQRRGKKRGEEGRREKEKGGGESGKVKGSGTCWGPGWCCLFPVSQLRAEDTQDANKGVTAWIYCISSCLNPNKPSLFTVYQGLGEALRRGLCGQDPAWAGRQQAGSGSGLGVSKLVERGCVCVCLCVCVHVYVCACVRAKGRVPLPTSSVTSGR